MHVTYIISTRRNQSPRMLTRNAFGGVWWEREVNVSCIVTPKRRVWSPSRTRSRPKFPFGRYVLCPPLSEIGRGTHYRVELSQTVLRPKVTEYSLSSVALLPSSMKRVAFQLFFVKSDIISLLSFWTCFKGLTRSVVHFWCLCACSRVVAMVVRVQLMDGCGECSSARASGLPVLWEFPSSYDRSFMLLLVCSAINGFCQLQLTVAG